jgi:diguanylate cyclase (GGDEF)-like protein
VLWLAPSLTSVQRRLYQDLLYGICVLIKPCPEERIAAAAIVCLQQDKGRRDLQNQHAGADWGRTLRQGLLGLGEDGRIRYANRAASQLLHIPPLQLSGLYMQSLMEAPVPGLVPDPMSPALTQMMSQAQPVELPRCPLWRGDGRHIICHAALVPGGASFALLVAFRQLPVEEMSGEGGQQSALDLLTGLPTLGALEQTLVALLACDDVHPALMVLDIDHLRHINETLGYELGDQLLRLAAGRLQQVMLGLGTLFRVGGDRFVALIDRVADFREAGRLGQRLNAQFRQPFLLGGNEDYCGLSFGVALYPGSGDTADSLLHSGEVALEKAKSLGRNIVQFYSAELNRHSLEQMERESGLHHVLARAELPLRLHGWQGTDGRPWGLNAELDWQPPGVAKVDAEAVAAESGLTCALHRRIMHQLLGRAGGLPPLPADFCLMFSLSASCLRDPRTPGRLISLVSHNHWEPQRIQLNLQLDGSEDWALLEPLLRDMAAHGLRFGLCLDRRGLPLEPLGRLPWQSLVLHPGLVAQLGADDGLSTVARSLIGFGRQLGLRVLVGGVDGSALAGWLFHEGVTACSGSGLGSGLSSATLTAWLELAGKSG